MLDNSSWRCISTLIDHLNEKALRVKHANEHFIRDAFFLIGIIFDAVVKLFEWIDDTIEAIIELVGSFFTSEDKPGESSILPPTPKVLGIIGNYDKEHGTTYERCGRQGKATIGVIQDGNGKIVCTGIVGSDKGFDNKIVSAHRKNRTYSNKIK